MLEELGKSGHDFENCRFEEYCHKRYEELPQRLQHAAKKLAKHQSLVKVELLFILLSHSPLSYLEYAWTKLLLVEFDHEGIEALDDAILNGFAYFRALLASSVRQSEALL